MEFLKNIYRFLSPRHQNVFLDYRVNPVPRAGLNPHPLLFELIKSGDENYRSTLTAFLQYKEIFTGLKKSGESTEISLPAWNNGFLPGLDMVGIFGMIAKHKPKKYIEIGSGNSTKMARFAINSLGLPTSITSIDPYPRAEIDALADTVIRQPLENIGDISWIYDQLEENDILFIDNSHRSFSNSDVTVCFLEILPRLKKGVIVHIHDIYIPYDYPAFMAERFYNEQYMLATMILANPLRYTPVLPNFYISKQSELSGILQPIWEHPSLQGVEQHGGSFYLQIGS